jgi:hypothetical protein
MEWSSPTLSTVTNQPAPHRVARGVLLAVTSAALSVAAHGAAGGSLTEFLPVLPLIVLTAFAGTAVAARRRSPFTVLGALGATQVAQHLLLSLVHNHHAAANPGFGFDAVQMTSAHVLAALLTGLLLIKADAAAFALVAAVSRLLPRRLPPAPVRLVPPVAVPRTGEPAALIEVLLRRVNSRRGPPVVLIT